MSPKLTFIHLLHKAHIATAALQVEEKEEEDDDESNRRIRNRVNSNVILSLERKPQQHSDSLSA